MPSFEVVLAAAKSGDERAFEQLYRELHRRVYAFAQARGSIDAEGVVNDVFLQVFTHVGSFVGNETQFKAWLFTIARNKMIDSGRRRQRRPTEVTLDAATEESLRATDDSEETALARVGSESMLQYLDYLTDDQRDVLLLRVVADLTVVGTAEVLHKPPGAVKALQRRALRALAQRISVAERTPLASYDVGSV